MSAEAPRIYGIPAGRSFVDALAEGLLARFGSAPLAFSRVTLLLPTRRACRSLAEAFLRASEGQPLLLPRFLPLGDLDADELLIAGEETLFGAAAGLDLPPALPPARRQLILARLIQSWAEREAAPVGRPGPSEDQAIRLAAELAALLDQVETEGLGFEGLERLVPADLAAHWQTTLRFLAIVTREWPAIQADEGAIGPAERRRRLLEAQAEAWRAKPPADPVLVAGSTGSIPAAAALMQVVAALPQGAVVLPGLDRDSDEDDWRAMADDPTHPQYGLARLLQRLAVPRAAVADWAEGAAAPLALRSRFVNWALLPAERTAAWRDLAQAAAPDALATALSGIRRIDCPGSAEEATAIALLLREALETPGRRAALVTPDRALARRVAAELARWQITVDDSAGTPLAETPPGTFLRLTAEMLASDLAPLPLLAALKHPLAAGGMAPGAFRAQVRALERAVLRGPRPAPGFAGLRAALAKSDAAEALMPWLDALAALAAPCMAHLARSGSDLAALLRTHVALAEALAATDESDGAARLWAQEAGEAAAGFVAELLDCAELAPRLSGAAYPAVLTGLMTGRMVRARYGTHPRLAILGPLEARLQTLDLLVLGGLNEGSWPAETDPGPWLSRPMRVDFGLPSIERRVGLAAHDFAQALAAPQVVITRATRVEGTPTVPSRWLLRLDALLTACGLPPLAAEPPGTPDAWQRMAELLDQPQQDIGSRPPAPCPPVAARPRRLSVTQVETWMRDPYALYARHVLKLRLLDPLDQDPGAADLGTLIHRALEDFVQAHPNDLPARPEAALLACGREAFRALESRPGAYAFWWPRFCRIAQWFIETEAARRQGLHRSCAELRGEITLAGPAGPFLLSGMADRIDQRADGGLVIIDYKTGQRPSAKALQLGFAPQLPLEAVIAAAGGFGPDLPAALPVSLEYWRLTGRNPPGEIHPVKGNLADLADQARAGLEQLIARFDDPATPYPAQPRPEWALRYNDYAHLERVKAWATADGGEAVS